MANDAHVRDFLDALPLMAVLISADGATRYANTPAQRFTSKLKQKLPPSLAEAIARAIEENRSTHVQGENLPGDAARIWVSPLDGAALLLIDEQPSAHDYTQLSSTMAAILAHEVRNPLLSIKGAAQLLATTAGQEDQPLTKLIVDEVGRIEQLMATLDPLSAVPMAGMQTLNVHELIEHALLAVKAAVPHSIAIDKQYDPSLPEVFGQRDALVQMLVNIMKNAYEATEQVGMPRMLVSSRYVLGEPRRNEAGQRLPVAISISDNGRGVPPAFVPHLFAPFSTTKTTGKGLGLAVSARIAESHGGLVAYERPDHGGARFTLYLPIADSGARPAA